MKGVAMPNTKDSEPNTDNEDKPKALGEETKEGAQKTEAPEAPDFEFMSGPRRNVYVFG